MKKIFSVLLSVVMVFGFCVNTTAKAIMFTPSSFEVHSAAAILLNLDTKEVLYQKNADTQYMPGTLVQIMEAIVVLENCPNLSMHITVDPTLYTNIETPYPEDIRYADFREGDTFTVEELLYAIMLTSSSEAAITLANQFGNGSIPNFVAMMNDKAADLGCTQTKFTNVTGIYDVAQKTTANDMALIMEYAMSNGKFESIATSPAFTPYSPNLDRHEEGWTWAHSNLMVQPTSEFYMEEAKGIKTANLTQQGRNIIVEASKDGSNFLAILLAAPFNDKEDNLQFYHMEDAENLFNWVFYHFSFRTILSENTELGQISVKNGEGVDYVLVRPEKSFGILWYDMADVISITQDVELEESVSAPVKEGQKLGTVTLKYSGEELATLNLVATSSVELSKFRYYLALAKHFPKTSWLTWAIVLSSMFGLIYIVICVYFYMQYQNRKKAPVYLRPNSFEIRKEARKEEQPKKKKAKPKNS